MSLQASCSIVVIDDRTCAAVIQRTSYVIPHIMAKSEADTGYCLGYAYAQNRLCLLDEEMVTVSGEKAPLVGKSQNQPFLRQD